MNQQSLLDAESSLVDRAFRCDTCGENPHRIVDSIGDPEPNREISMKITKVTPWLLLATAAYNFGRQGEPQYSWKCKLMKALPAGAR